MTSEAIRTEPVVLSHRIFQREFSLLADLVRRTPAGDNRRAAQVAEHVDLVLTALHIHHGLLAERAEPLGDAAVRLLDAWWTAPSTTLSHALADVLARLSATTLPPIPAHLDAGEFAERCLGQLPYPAVLIMLGLLLEGAPPAEGAGFLATLPPLVRLMWRLSGRRRYARYIRLVRGTRKQAHPAARTLWRTANKLAVALYRRSDGRVGGSARGLPVLLITVPGRVTGRPHTVPVAYFEHGGGYVVTGSSGGSPVEPQWLRNLRVSDRANVRIAGHTFDVDTRVPGGDERDRLWHDVVLDRAPFFAGYQEKAGRVIPVAVLTRTAGGAS